MWRGPLVMCKPYPTVQIHPHHLFLTPQKLPQSLQQSTKHTVSVNLFPKIWWWASVGRLISGERRAWRGSASTWGPWRRRRRRLRWSWSAGRLMVMVTCYLPHGLGRIWPAAVSIRLISWGAAASATAASRLVVTSICIGNSTLPTTPTPPPPPLTTTITTIHIHTYIYDLWICFSSYIFTISKKKKKKKCFVQYFFMAGYI